MINHDLNNDVVGEGINEQIVKSVYLDRTQFNHSIEHNDTIMNCNIRGLRANINNLREYLNVSHTNNIKIIVVTEVFKACHTHQDNYLKGYNYVSKLRSSNPQRGGVGIFTHASIKTKEIDISEFHRDGNTEIMATLFPTYKMVIISAYRPNGHEDANTYEFIERLAKAIKYIKNTVKETHIIITGDFNINILQQDVKWVRDFTNTLVTEGFLPLITIPTRITQGTATCLDHFWSNKAESITHASVLNDSYVSDHLATSISLNTKSKITFNHIKKRKYTDENIREFRNTLSMASWNDIHSMNDNNRKWSSLITVIMEAHIKAALRKI